MNTFQLSFDVIMCILWVITYTLCFISTKIYKYPALPPITQLVIAPFEFAVMFRLITTGSFSFDYVSCAYLYWTLIEIGLCIQILKYAFQFARKKVVLYLAALMGMTSLMIYLVVVKNQMFFFSYFNTFIGEVFWLCYLFKKDYPIKPINLIAFIAKFVGDAISIPVYLHSGSIISSIICVLLPVLDFVFICVFFVRFYKGRKEKA